MKLFGNHLIEKGYHSVAARIVGNARLRRRRGGIRPWPSVRTDIMNHLREDKDGIATTMVDYYGMPQNGPGEWPGSARSSGLRTIEAKAQCVQDAVRDDLLTALGARFYAQRFVPFVVMHEFEGLLFSDCAAFSRGICRPDLEPSLRERFATPDEINDSPVTAPSKLVEALEPRYNKPLFGKLATLKIGLAHIREECPHFDGWLKQLESLVH
jgi:hypothetical protein